MQGRTRSNDRHIFRHVSVTRTFVAGGQRGGNLNGRRHGHICYTKLRKALYSEVFSLDKRLCPSLCALAEADYQTMGIF